MAAALFGDARLVEVLLSHRADPNVTGPGGTTALIWAVPDIQKVRTLLDHGAAVNAKTETERTALLVAASYPRTSDLLRLLLERGADLRAQDRGGATRVVARRAISRHRRRPVSRGSRDRSRRARPRRAAGWSRAMGSADGRISAGQCTGASQGDARRRRDLAAGRARGPLDRSRSGRQRCRRPVRTDSAVDSRRIRGRRRRHAQAPARPRRKSQHGDDGRRNAARLGRLQGRSRQDPAARAARGDARQWSAARDDRPAAPAVSPTRASPCAAASRESSTLPGFPERTSCISCHHNALPAMLPRHARRKGIEIDEARARANIDDIVEFFTASCRG